MTPTRSFRDISDAVSGFLTLTNQFFPAKTTYPKDVIFKNLNNN